MFFKKKKKIKRIKEWKQYKSKSEDMILFELNELSNADNDMAIHAKLYLFYGYYIIFYPIFEMVDLNE